MAENRYDDTHPVWEDMLGLGLGVLIVLTPYFTADAVSTNRAAGHYLRRAHGHHRSGRRESAIVRRRA